LERFQPFKHHDAADSLGEIAPACADTLYDGDTIFALSCGEIEGVEVSVVGALAAEATAQAVERGVRKAGSLGSVPSFSNLNR